MIDGTVKTEDEGEKVKINLKIGRESDRLSKYYNTKDFLKVVASNEYDLCYVLAAMARDCPTKKCDKHDSWDAENLNLRCQSGVGVKTYPDSGPPIMWLNISNNVNHLAKKVNAIVNIPVLFVQ